MIVIKKQLDTLSGFHPATLKKMRVYKLINRKEKAYLNKMTPADRRAKFNSWENKSEGAVSRTMCEECSMVVERGHLCLISNGGDSPQGFNELLNDVYEDMDDCEKDAFDDSTWS